VVLSAIEFVLLDCEYSCNLLVIFIFLWLHTHLRIVRSSVAKASGYNLKNHECCCISSPGGLVHLHIINSGVVETSASRLNKWQVC
jgi:hypothetical protein